MPNSLHSIISQSVPMSPVEPVSSFEQSANVNRIYQLESLLRRTLVAMRDPDDDGPFDLDMLESDISTALGE